MQPHARLSACKVGYLMLCRLPLAGDRLTSVQQRWVIGLRGCAVNGTTCAKEIQLVSRLFYFLEDRKVTIMLSIHNSMSVMWHTPRFNRQSP